jgi:hypothetical protein
MKICWNAAKRTTQLSSGTEQFRNRREGTPKLFIRESKFYHVSTFRFSGLNPIPVTSHHFMVLKPILLDSLTHQWHHAEEGLMTLLGTVNRS